jgi:hypothetical protein
MKKIFVVVVLAAIGLGSWWLYHNQGEIKDTIKQYVENGEFLTLEAKYTGQQIMEANRKMLLADDQHKFQEPILKFSPYLLLEVKYFPSDQKPREGVILWSLVDGEMVLDTSTWERTHGFEDAIAADATRHDFKILNALAKNGGIMTRDQLQKELHLEIDTITPWIDSTLKKHLVVQKGNELQLHFQNPKILVPPQTKISQWLSTKPYSHAQRVSSKYSKSQIENISKAAFGSDFTIRHINEVYLPIYNIEVLNPDGSITSTEWNAQSGQRINPKYLVY